MERNQIPYFSKNCSIQRTNWTLPENSNAIPKPNYIAHTFNNYFVSITETTIYLYIYIYIYIYYLSNESGSAKFLQSTDKEKIAKVSTLMRLLSQIIYLMQYYFF